MVDSKQKKLTPNDNKQNMFQSVDDIKALIIWAKSMGLKRIKVGEVEAEISEVAYALEQAASDSSDTKLPPREELSTARTWADDAPKTPVNEDEDLFWSSGS
jgi:hypothetical protein